MNAKSKKLFLASFNFTITGSYDKVIVADSEDEADEMVSEEKDSSLCENIDVVCCNTDLDEIELPSVKIWDKHNQYCFRNGGEKGSFVDVVYVPLLWIQAVGIPAAFEYATGLSRKKIISYSPDIFTMTGELLEKVSEEDSPGIRITKDPLGIQSLRNQIEDLKAQIYELTRNS